MEVVLYHSDTCPQCKLFVMMLDKKGIKYTSIKNIDDMIAKGVNHTPTLEVDGKQMVGKEAIDWIKAQ